MSRVVLPGGIIGIIGSGQLGRMLAMAARPLGYQIHIFSPAEESPAGQVSDFVTIADYTDDVALTTFARNVDVVTYEFENVPVTALTTIQEIKPVVVNQKALFISQHRIREKHFLTENNFPVVPFEAVRSAEALQQAVTQLGLPCVLKTAASGYDGKGQFTITKPEDVSHAWETLNTPEAVLEKLIEFEKEFSVIVTRAVDGTMVHYGAIENQNSQHILDLSFAPGRIPPEVGQAAIEIANDIVNLLGFVGTFCVEFFLGANNEFWINELAPRVHNSGHWTQDACITGQFEQHIRAICGLSLGSPEQLRPAVMANLLGDLWQHGEPDWAALSSLPNVKLHLYGKASAKPKRKMGHLTILADSVETGVRTAYAARNRLSTYATNT